MPQDRGGDTILAQGATALLRAARAGDAPFVELLLKNNALVDLPSKEGVTPLMAAAGVEFGTRVTRGRNRTNEGVLASMKLLVDAGANINARSITEPRSGRGGAPAEASQAAQYALNVRRGSQMPSAQSVPHETALHGAAARGLNDFVKFLADHGADLQAKDAKAERDRFASGTGESGAAGRSFGDVKISGDDRRKTRANSPKGGKYGTCFALVVLQIVRGLTHQAEGDSHLNL